MLSILLPLLLLTSTLAAPSSPALPGHHHRLGRRARSFLNPTPRRPAPAHVGRLSGSRTDIREHSSTAEPHDIIPDSGEIWELPEIEPNPGFILQAEADGRRSILPEEVMTRAWTELVNRPEATGVGSEDDSGAGPRTWFDGELVGELSVEDEGVESQGEGGRWWNNSWWGGEDAAGEADVGADTIDNVLTESNDVSSPFRVAAKASAPVGGWGVNPKGEWYLVHLD